MCIGLDGLSAEKMSRVSSGLEPYATPQRLSYSLDTLSLSVR